MTSTTHRAVRGVSLGLLATGLLVLSGCATRGSVENSMASRAQMQAEIARQDAASQPPVDLDNRVTYLRVVSQMQQKGLYFASLAHIDALQQRWGSDPESSLLRADALRQTGQPEAARGIYGPLLSTSVKAKAAHGLGLLAGRAGDLTAATDYLQQANRAAPTDPAILNDLGYVLMQQGRWTEARVPLLKASELQDDNPRVWSNVALYLTLDGQPEQALSVMDKHQVPDTSRLQIAELARTIQQRYKPAAVPPSPPAAPVAVALPVAVSQPVLRPSLGTAMLVSAPVVERTATTPPAIQASIQ